MLEEQNKLQEVKTYILDYHKVFKERMRDYNMKKICSDCKREFGSGYKSSVEDWTCQQCDVFEWCWDCDEKHTEEEIRELK